MNEIESKLVSIENKIKVPECGQFVLTRIEKKKINYKKAMAYAGVVACIILLLYIGAYNQLISIKNEKSTSMPEVTNSDYDIVLNPAGEVGGGRSISVRLNCANNNFEQSVPVYEVTTSLPSEVQITNILSKLKFTNPIEKVDQENITYTDKKGNLFTLNVETGRMEYMSERIQNGKADDVIEKPFTKDQYIKKAQSFIKELGFVDNLYVESAQEDMFVQGYDEKNRPFNKPVRYLVTFVKNPVDGLDFAGTGPGIKLEFDASGEIVSMLRIEKSLRKLPSLLLTKNETEIREALTKGEYFLSGMDSDQGELELDSYQLVLYSDSAEIKQNYMVPFYVFTGKNLADGSKVTLTMNALKKEDYHISDANRPLEE